MARVATRVALALLLALVLGACSLGLPPRGRVVVVKAVSAPASAPAEASAAQLPTPGLNPLAVARGFMLAMSSGPPSLAAAWTLSGDPRVHAQVAAWGSTDVRAVYNGFTTGLPVIVGSAATVPVTLVRSGTFDARHQWSPATGTATITLALRRDAAGQWRVTNPPTVPWINLPDFLERWTRCEVFFVAPDGQHLTPSPVFVPGSSDLGTPCTPARAADLTALARSTVEALLAGPKGRAAPSLVSAIPPGTRLNSLRIVGQTVHVDLSASFALPTGESGRLRVGQIVWSVTQIGQTDDVLVTIDGRRARAVGPDHFDAAEPLLVSDASMAALAPPRSGNAEETLFVRSPPGAIFSINLNALGQRALPVRLGVGSRTEANPTWAPDGRHVAFLTRGASSAELWVGSAPQHRSSPTAVTGDLSAPTWMPNGSAVLVLRATHHHVELLMVPLTHAYRPSGVRQVAFGPLPGGLTPTALRVGPDGAFVVAVGAPKGSSFGAGGALFVGALTPLGVVSWSGPIAPGLGTEYSPVWIDPTTLAFIAQAGAPPTTGAIWTVPPDGWEPARVALSGAQGLQLGQSLTVDPAGLRFVFTVQAQTGTSLDAVTRYAGGLEPVTSSFAVNAVSDDTPSLASG